MDNIKEFAVRGQIFHMTGNPFVSSRSFRYFKDGVFVVSDGQIEYLGTASECLSAIKDSMPVYEYPDCLICPGFVDTHIHYVQSRIVGSPAPGLLEWLENHTFPEELRFKNSAYAAEVASDFFDELARNGTTSALVYPTVHSNSVDCFFEESNSRNMRMVAGKVLMNRNAPQGLQDGADCGQKETEALIREWHGKGRQSYAITLRFAGTSTHEQMKVCSGLVQKYPDLLFHTHLSETKAEIEWTLGLFPEYSDYLAVYEGYGMVTEKSIFAHCIYLSYSERMRLANSGAAIAMCPTSNMFLGSGLIKPNRLRKLRIPLSLGTDIGGGTSFSMFHTMREIYKVARVVGDNMSAFELFYLATLGGAKALHIDEYVGSLEEKKEADFVVLDAGSSKVIKARMERAESVDDLLFAYVILGGWSNVRETWSMGKRLYKRMDA